MPEIARQGFVRSLPLADASALAKTHFRGQKHTTHTRHKLHRVHNMTAGTARRLLPTVEHENSLPVTEFRYSRTMREMDRETVIGCSAYVTSK
jgi:hypothetical protein